MKSLALELIKLYQITLSRVMLSACRYSPTCSQYTYEAIEKYGFPKGVGLGLRRFLRCNPLFKGGYDPVP